MLSTFKKIKLWRWLKYSCRLSTCNRNIINKTKEKYLKEVPNLVLDNDDWNRFSFAYDLVVGDTVADIGTGHGVMVNALMDSGRFSKVTGVDIKTHSQALLHDKVHYVEASIIDPEFSISKHDTVICMEVIEHLESEHNKLLLKNLRRTAGKRLIVTVPYNEPRPLWWHDQPGGHRQCFSVGKISKLFPNGMAAIQPRYGIDWIFIIEDSRIHTEKFKLFSKKDLLVYLNRVS